MELFVRSIKKRHTYTQKYIYTHKRASRSSSFCNRSWVRVGTIEPHITVELYDDSATTLLYSTQRGNDRRVDPREKRERHTQGELEKRRETERVKRRRSWPIAFWPAKLLIQAVHRKREREREPKRRTTKNGRPIASQLPGQNRCSKSHRAVSVELRFDCFCTEQQVGYVNTKIQGRAPVQMARWG